MDDDDNGLDGVTPAELGVGRMCQCGECVCVNEVDAPDVHPWSNMGEQERD